MSDTITSECRICGEETDCINDGEGMICQECVCSRESILKEAMDEYERGEVLTFKSYFEYRRYIINKYKLAIK